MKSFVTLLLSIVMASAYAQTKTEAPKNDYALSVSESTITLKPGESRAVTVSLARSKSYAKGNIRMYTSSTLPKGVTVQYSPAEGNFDTSVATISIAPEVTSSSFYVIVSSEIYGRVKASTVKVTVDGQPVVGSRD